MNMTHLETARVNELIGLQIGIVQQAARNLNPEREIQEIEADIAALESTLSDLKSTLAGIAHKA
jgi:cell division protein FtsL